MSTMDKTEELMISTTIETTLGDLIHAIAEAAREATVEEKDLSEVTQQVLAQVLRKRKYAV